jgi:Zn-finger nucleic acid-binding protein
MGRKHSHDERSCIACLACGETRVVRGVEPGECPRCHYVGWVPAGDLDGSTRSAIMNRAFARHQRAFALRP